jgi:hypothetical protein
VFPRVLMIGQQPPLFSLLQLSELLPSNHPDIEPEDLPDWHIDISMILTEEESSLPTLMPTVIIDDAPATEFSIEEVEVNIEDNQPTTEEVNIENNQPITDKDLPSGSPTAQAILDTVESMSVEVLPTDIPFSVYSGHRALVKEMIVPPFKHHPTINHLFMAHQPGPVFFGSGWF